jgi:hypothetical protein
LSDLGAREWLCAALEVEDGGDQPLQHGLLVLPGPFLVFED